ncbi:MAG: 50S ribosomal protein L17 [Candidatus Abawacabacteria bacterium RIFCSPHIGHO2_01_FULL_46_8]|uniref:50S ribosomal protein L17 n=1 Tax=Candidatus Abawacabacteria bacterium RIFCSPHIGHO2_01_FULL_46_8 TaxID=1817815 RepID=A0A1F4XM73_9BACT|nr:MAG: 50S ribosomal protein L17 [Candidatus Abawacabacteria bacterium RIFCSPHIGHO2_01_FULL_46_8]
MRHRVKGKTLGRQADHRDHMMRNLTASLIIYEKITTTQAKAKAVAPMIEKLISGAQRRERRMALIHLKKFFFDQSAAQKVMDVLLDRYKQKQSGFTRINKLARTRVGDGASMVSLELT